MGQVGKWAPNIPDLEEEQEERGSLCGLHGAPTSYYGYWVHVQQATMWWYWPRLDPSQGIDTTDMTVCLMRQRERVREKRTDGHPGGWVDDWLR